jgi:hypothetical protein
MIVEPSRWELVPAAKIYEIFAMVVKVPGFQSIAKGILARQITSDIVHVIKLEHYKGAFYGFRWGVSLTYLPHTWDGGLRWHRTLKTARLDLFDQFFDLPPALNRSTLPPGASVPSSLHGVELFQQDLLIKWKDCETTIAEWLDCARNLEGVLSMSSEQSHRVWKGPQHDPPPGLVYAFTLARIGRGQEAHKQLRALVASGLVSDQNGHLVSALQKVP